MYFIVIYQKKNKKYFMFVLVVDFLIFEKCNIYLCCIFYKGFSVIVYFFSDVLWK